MHPGLRLLILTLFFLSGACGLIYEITWMRLFRLVMGNTVFTSATILTVFMAGLALGSYVAGRLIDRYARPLFAYGVLEGSIGLYCLALIPVFGWVEPVYALLYRFFADSFVLLGLSRFLVSAIQLILPTPQKGATLPLLSRFLSMEREKLGRDIGQLYALNTLGAALGAASTGFLLISDLGVRTTLVATALCNLLICAAAFWLSRRHESATPSQKSSPPSTSARNAGSKVVLWGLVGAGFASMIYEVAWTRTLSMLIGSSVYAFTLMLVAFISGLGLGSIVLSSWIDRRKNLLLCLGSLELIVGLSALLITPLFNVLPLYIVDIVTRYAGSFEIFHLVEFLVVFLLMLVPTFVMGGIFPIVAKIYTREINWVGRSVGEAYAANTLGAVLGSFVGGFLLMPWLGAKASILVGVGLNLLLGLYFILTSRWIVDVRRSLAAAVALLLIVGVGAAKLPAWDTLLLNSAPYLYAQQYQSKARLDAGDITQAIKKNRRLLYAREGMTATVTVWDLLGELYMRINGKVTASSKGKDLRSHSLLVHIPLLLHSAPKDVLLIGLGCGISLGVLEQYPVEAIECVELSPEVAEGAELFSQVNYDALRDQRLKLIIGDGRNHVALGDEQYDIIISQPSNLWIAGMTDLFTREFFTACRERLAEGGLVGTWIQAYSLPERDVKTIVKTFRTVFPHVTMWELMPEVDYLLIGADHPLPLQYGQFADRLALPHLQADLQRNGVGSAKNLVCSFVMQDEKIDTFVGSAPVNTDDNAILEFSAPKGLYRDLSRQSGIFSLESLVPYRQADLSFLEDPPEEDLEHAWKARQLALEGSRHQKGQQYAQALDDLEQAAGYDTRDMEVRRVFPELTFMLAEKLMRQRRYDAALEVYDRLLKAIPDNATGHYRRGELYEYLKRKERAINAYERAIELAPKFISSHMRLGALYMSLKKLEQAAEVYRRGLVEHPEHLGLLSNLGTVYLLQKRFAEGIEVYHRILDLAPENARALNNLGTAYIHNKDFSEAVHWLQRAIERRPQDALLHKKLAEAYWRVGNVEQAQQELRTVLKLTPEDRHARRLLNGLE